MYPKQMLLHDWPCLRNCRGAVEVWEVEYEDATHDFKVRYLPPGKSAAEGYMGVFLNEAVARAVARNWAEGTEEPPWAHLVDGNWERG